MTIAVSQSEFPQIVFHSIKCFSVWEKKEQACGISCCTEMWLFCLLSHDGAHRGSQSKSPTWVVRGMQTEIAVTCLFPGRWERGRVKWGCNLKEERFKKCRPFAVIPQGFSAKWERRQANKSVISLVCSHLATASGDNPEHPLRANNFVCFFLAPLLLSHRRWLWWTVKTKSGWIHS